MFSSDFERYYSGSYRFFWRRKVGLLCSNGVARCNHFVQSLWFQMFSPCFEWFLDHFISLSCLPWMILNDCFSLSLFLWLLSSFRTCWLADLGRSPEFYWRDYKGLTVLLGLQAFGFLALSSHGDESNHLLSYGHNRVLNTIYLINVLLDLSFSTIFYHLATFIKGNDCCTYSRAGSPDLADCNWTGPTPRHQSHGHHRYSRLCITSFMCAKSLNSEPWKDLPHIVGYLLFI